MSAAGLLSHGLHEEEQDTVCFMAGTADRSLCLGWN
jgi:hypothetical protein